MGQVRDLIMSQGTMVCYRCKFDVAKTNLISNILISHTSVGRKLFFSV